MSGSLDSLQELLNEHGMTITDLEYIVRYLKKENISPQLAMRRIKSFDVLQQKMEDNSEKEVISELRKELASTEHTLKKELETTEARMQSILSEKTRVEDEKSKLENMTDLFDSERDELRNQLKMLQEMQIEEIETDDSTTEGLQSLLKALDFVISTKLEVKELLLPIIDAIEQVEKGSNISFNQNAYINSVDGIFAKAAPVQTTPSTPEKKVSKPIDTFRDQTMRKPSDVVRDQVKQPEKKVKKDKPKPKEKPKVDPRAVQVLDLFLDFLAEADNDKNFKDRISSICEMDEAYEHLGSIGLSQVYSFQSRGLEKKEELVKLLQSWKIEGVPR